MIAPKCDRCGNELEEYGAILFGPPDKKNLSKKQHLCVTCYKLLNEIVRGKWILLPPDCAKMKHRRR